MDKYIVAVAQMDSGQDKELNLCKIEKLTEEACRAGASFIVFPEVSSLMPSSREEMISGAERVPGPTTNRLSKLAIKKKMWIHCGSMLEVSEEENKCYNTSVVINPEGEITATYRKIHLFDVDIAGGPSIQESASYLGGSSIKTIDTEIGNLGLSICYDLRFPELYRIMALRGANILIIPACFTADTGKEHWEPLLRARAIENMCYVLAPGQIGRKPKYRAHGKSSIIDPWGTVMATKASGEGIITAEIDLKRPEKLRRAIPCLKNRKPDIYDWL